MDFIRTEYTPLSRHVTAINKQLQECKVKDDEAHSFHLQACKCWSQHYLSSLHQSQ